jgi:proteasome accessory factor C
MLEYFPMRVLRELSGGSCEVAMTFAAEEWMTRLILGLGADVQVLTPESLVLSVRRAATAALAAYGGLDG